METIEFYHVHFTLLPKLANMCSQEPIKIAFLDGCFFLFRLSLDLKHHVAMFLCQLYTCTIFVLLCFPGSSWLLAV